MADSPRHLLDERVAELVSDYVDRLAAGTAPPVEQYLGEHADLASEIGPLLRTALELADEARSIRLPSPDAAFNTIQGRLLADAERQVQRESVENGRGAVKIDQRSDVLLLLLRAAGEVWGRTRLQKLLFLVGKETKASVAVSDYFQHVAYDYGPFDELACQDVEQLRRIGLIEVRRPEAAGRGAPQVDDIYRLSTRGRQYADALARGEEGPTRGLTAEVQQAAGRYGRMSLKRLLQHVYRTYPEYATESTIREEVLGGGDDENDDR